MAVTICCGRMQPESDKINKNVSDIVFKKESHLQFYISTEHMINYIYFSVKKKTEKVLSDNIILQLIQTVTTKSEYV